MLEQAKLWINNEAYIQGKNVKGKAKRYIRFSDYANIMDSFLIILVAKSQNDLSIIAYRTVTVISISSTTIPASNEIIFAGINKN